MDPVRNDGENRRKRRKKKRMDEISIDSVSTISKIVDKDEVNKVKDEEVRKKKEPIRESSFEEDTQEQTKKRKKKLKKNNENNKEGSYSADNLKLKTRKKKRNSSLSSSEGFEKEERDEKIKLKRKDRRKITDSQSLLREDFYSDPQLATTLQGLEDDMYSINGDGDMSALSPYPLIPTIPSSQPVAKIYLEKPSGFSKTSVTAVLAAPTLTSGNISPRAHQTPLELGLTTQKVFRSLCIFCHGLLAGLAAWQVFTIYILHKDDLEFVSLYSPLSQPLQIVFYLLTIICTVSVCDRYDIAQFSLTNLQQLVTFQSGGVAILIYWATLLLTLITTKVEDKLSLYQYNTSLFDTMEEEDLSYQLETWKAMNLARSLAVVLGWFIVSLRPSTDRLYKNLKRLNNMEKPKTNKIETVRMA